MNASIVLSFDHCSSPGDAEQWYDTDEDRVINGYCVAVHKADLDSTYWTPGVYLTEGDSFEEARKTFREDLIQRGYNPSDYGV